ncbi:outer membrane protein/protective antigen OMA87 [Leptolyngbya sp. BL0902]|uniref:BamA/TamA family outer membrane protein n=1 Tax=Leptolyngbya sp. BL0902 TaxID=1115757 RepID=UPI0018E8D167|nr:BamA/TamA family outer membrane protein [Leptolyngbya sp. BL0902]QQE66209.1 outer membrane protein/protective antigen OMA87 [Leptolyngbya sp. BL0902]
MQVSPKWLVLLTAAGLVGLSPTAAQADPTLTEATEATSTLQDLPPAALSADALRPAVPTPPPQNSASAGADPLAATPSADEAGLPEESGPMETLPTASASGDQTLPIGLPEVTTLIPVSTVPEDLQAVVDEYRPSAVVEWMAEPPQPTLDLSQSPSLQGLGAPVSEGTALSQTGPREISPDDAQRILDGAVERRNQPQGVPQPSPEEASPAPGEATEPAAPPTPATPPPAATEPEEPRVLVSEVLVTAPDGDLSPDLINLVYSVIETRAGRTTTRTQLQRDINSIFATGFFADVDARPEDTNLGVRVTFLAQPNPVLTEVRVTGNQVLPQAVVDEIFDDQRGEIINLLDFQDGILELNQWYQDNGFVLAQVVAAPRVTEAGVVTLEVAEGVVETIEVRFFNDQGESVDEEGNPLRGRTHDHIITREFQTQPGDVFNQAQIERDFQRVFGLQIFEDVRPGLEPAANDPRQVKLIVNVTERSTGSVAAGLGFNFTGDIFGTVSYRQDNFGGNNQKLSAEAQVSTRDLLFDVSFTDPWIAGDPFRTSYTANAFARRAINLNFDGGPNPIDLPNGDRVRIRRLGGGVTFSRPLNNGWVVAVGTTAQNISARDADGTISPVDAAGNPLTLSGTGTDLLWTVPVSATLDRRNDVFNPTSGSVLRLNSEQSIPLGQGSIFMNRLRGSYSQYLPVRWINFSDGPQALAFNIQLGTIVGDVPPYEAFALGGTNSIRGYEEGEVGSGRSYAQFTAEYRFPLFSFLGGALFFDAGSSLGSGNAVPGAPGPSRGKPGSGFGYGLGARVQTPLGPLRIDYGFSNEGEGRLHFGIGERF